MAFPLTLVLVPNALQREGMGQSFAFVEIRVCCVHICRKINKARDRNTVAGEQYIKTVYRNCLGEIVYFKH